MALTKSILTGRVVLPTDAAPINAELVFTLSGLDSEGGDILPPGDPARCVLINGELPPGYSIWRNTEGYRGTHYIVTVMWTDMTRQGIRETIRELGKIQVGDNASYVLADLLAEGTVPAGETFWSAITEAEYQAVLDAADRAEAAAAALIDVSGYKARASEPIHTGFKIQKDGVWYSPDWLIQVGAGQSNRLGNANATNGSKTGTSTGNVFAWNGTSIVQATLGSLPFNTAAGQVNNIDFHEAHRISSETGRPVLIILHAIPGTSIGTWLPPYAGNSFTPGVNWTGLVNKIAAALSAGSAVLWGKTTVDLFGWSQGEDQYNLAPLFTLSTDRYPALINGVLGASWASPLLQFIATQCLPQSAGGTAFAANSEWDKVVASGAFERVFVVTGEGLVTTGADVGQIVHYDGASLQQLGYRSADIYLGISEGITSGAGEIASDATGMLRWKNRDYVRLVDLAFFPTNTFNQAITIGTTIAGVAVVFEVNGVRSEVVSAVSSSVYTLNSASPAHVVIWYPVAAARDQSPQLSLNSAAGQGMLRGIWINPIGGLGQVFCAGHEGLIHSVEPKSWPRPDPGNPVLPLNGLATFRINGSPLVTFDNFIAGDMPTTLTLLSFTSTTPVPGPIRTAIDAENTARGGTIAVTYGAAYAPYNAQTLTFEMFGAVGDGTGDQSAAMIRALTYAAGAPVQGRAGAIYRTLNSIATTDINWQAFGNGAKILVAANVDAVRAYYTPLGPYLLSGNYDYTSNPLVIPVAAMPTAPKAGYIMKIASKARDLGNRDEGSNADQYRTAEHFVVGPGSTTTSIAITQPLQFYLGGSDTSIGGDEPIIDAYTTTSLAQVILLNPADKFVFDGFDIEYEAGHDADPWTARCIRVRGCINPIIRNVNILFGYGPGLSLSGSYNAQVTNLSVPRLVNNTGLGQFGYGISNAAWGTIVSNSNFANNRHAITTSVARSTFVGMTADAILGIGRTGGMTISNCTASNNPFGLFDTHADAESPAFIGCYATGGGDDGLTIRGRDVSVTAMRIVNCKNGIQVQTERGSTGVDYDEFNNGTRLIDWTSARLTDIFMSVNGHCLNNVYSTTNVNGGDWRTSARAAIINNGTVYINNPLKITYNGSASDTTTAAIISVDKGTTKPNLAFPLHPVIVRSFLHIDYRTASGTNLTFMSSGDTAVAKIRIEACGITYAQLPSGASPYSSKDAFEIVDSGMLILDIGGVITVVTANPIIANGISNGVGDPGPSLTLENLDTATTSGQELARIDFKQNDSDNPKTVMGWIKMLFSNTLGNADLLFGTRGNSDIAVLLRMAITRTGHMIMYAVDGVTEWARFDITTQALTVNHATMSSAGIGYKQGETVSQATSKATAVTMTRASGRITMNAASLAPLTAVTFRINNTLIAVTDNILVQPRSPFAGYRIDAQIGAGFADITVTNTTAGALAEAVFLNVDLFKGSTTT